MDAVVRSGVSGSTANTHAIGIGRGAERHRTSGSVGNASLGSAPSAVRSGQFGQRVRRATVEGVQGNTSASGWIRPEDIGKDVI
jgi:hypothetical protein